MNGVAVLRSKSCTFNARSQLFPHKRPPYKAGCRTITHSNRISFSKAIRILGLESSADDTCAAIVDSDRNILANVVIRQPDLLEKWAGIHPVHTSVRINNDMPKAIRQCLDQANLDVSDVDAIAYTRGPGIPTCLAACALSAKTMSAVYRKPLIGVHHMQAHALTVGLTEDEPPTYPYLSLLVSGGHTLLLEVGGPFDFKIHATTPDESIGNVYEKVARLLAVPLAGSTSGGQALEKVAAQSTSPSLALRFPIAMHGQLSFSFSGLLSSVRKKIAESDISAETVKRDIAAAFQRAAVSQLEQKITLLLQATPEVNYSSLVVSGGVASNQFLRNRLRQCLDRNNRASMRSLFPPVALCTDNAAMIAWAAHERYSRGMFDTFDSLLRPKWSIEDCADVVA